jgi:DNA-directed RNA polymerase subunit beta
LTEDIPNILEEKNLDDIDDLKNKVIRSNGDLLSNHLKIILLETRSNIKQNLERFIENFRLTKNLIKLNEIINSYNFSRNIKNFFTSNQLSQIIEETNPLTEIIHKRRICSFGSGGINRKRANLAIREIHPSHFGRICPIETSEGKNAGLVLSLAKDAKVNKYGFIETPYFVRLNKT